MTTAKNLRDYSVTLQDGAGRTASVSINADTIREMLAAGYSLDGAIEEVEQNAFQNAIARGDIGADAFVAPRVA